MQGRPPIIPPLPTGNLAGRGMHNMRPMPPGAALLPQGSVPIPQGNRGAQMSGRSSQRSMPLSGAPRSIPLLPSDRTRLSASCGPARKSLGPNPRSASTFARRAPIHHKAPASESLASRVARTVTEKVTGLKAKVIGQPSAEELPQYTPKPRAAPQTVLKPVEDPRIPVERSPLEDRYQRLKEHETEKLLAMAEQRPLQEKRDRYVVLPGGTLAKPRDVYVESLPDGHSSFGDKMLVMSLEDLLRRYDALDEHYKKLKMENSELRNIVWKIYSGMPSVSAHHSYGQEMIQNLGNQVGNSNPPTMIGVPPGVRYQ